MKIESLENTSIESIVACLNSAFEHYFVEMPREVYFWQNRFKAARVDYRLSFGVFDHGKLVAFILHGIDQHQGMKTAFNTGTGVLKAYRGQQLVDKMYTYAIPILKNHGVQKCMLEVIEENGRAIRVYERIGFKKSKHLRCFHGNSNKIRIATSNEQIDIQSLKNRMHQFQHFYSWDNSMDAITAASTIFEAFLIKDENGLEIGYFILNVINNALIQIETFDVQNWSKIIRAVHSTIPKIKINNVDGTRKILIDALIASGLDNYINQFEMELPI